MRSLPVRGCLDACVPFAWPWPLDAVSIVLGNVVAGAMVYTKITLVWDSLSRERRWEGGLLWLTVGQGPPA